MSDWHEPWPETKPEPKRWRPQERERVRIRKEPGTVIDVWWSPRGFDAPGRWFVRVQLDRGARVTCGLDDVRPLKRKAAR